MSKTSKSKVTASSVIDASYELQTALDFSYFDLDKFEDALEARPRIKLKKCPETKKYKTNVVWFKNNSLTGFEDFESAMEKLIVDPASLEFLDLSFNEFTGIDEVLQKYTNLKVIYLHGNQISKLKEIDNLACLPMLQTITLNGNPIESEEHFKNYTIKKLTHLKKFNTATVTKQDRQNAQYASLGKQKRGGRRADAS